MNEFFDVEIVPMQLNQVSCISLCKGAKQQEATNSHY